MRTSTGNDCLFANVMGIQKRGIVTIMLLVIATVVVLPCLAQEPDTLNTPSTNLPDTTSRSESHLILQLLEEARNDIGKLVNEVDSLKGDKDTLSALSPYSVSIGANFDFIDGLRAEDIYADLNVRVDLFENESGKLFPGKPVGIEIGFFQNKSFSQDTLPDFSRIPVSSRRGALTTSDTYWDIELLSDSIAVTRLRRTVENTSSEIKNLSLYGDLYFQQNKWLSPSLHFEIRRRHSVINVRGEDERLTGPDTTTVQSLIEDGLIGIRISEQTGDTSLVRPGRRRGIPRTGLFEDTIYEGVVGISPHIRYEDEFVRLSIKPILGLRFFARTIAPFLKGQFEIIEKKFGIKLRAEVRIREAADPEIAMSLSKVFSLSKLATLFGTTQGDN